MSLDKICLLGGYGDVGLRLARLLHSRSEVQIILAGRNGAYATSAANRIGSRCEGMALDIKQANAYKQLKNMTLCINLTEATPPVLAATLVANGIHFIDSSASPDYVELLKKAIKKIDNPQAAAVLEAGLAPGLTNLLAKRLYQDNPDTRRIDVLIEMGMGVHHGFAATEWTVKALGQTYPIKINGQWQQIRTGELSRTFDIDNENIYAIGFAFSDQQSIASSHNLDSARTFLAVSPSWMTHLLGKLCHPTFSAFINRHVALLTRWMLKMPTMGGMGTRLIVEAYDDNDNILASKYISGGPQADLTAAVLADTALAIMQSKLALGLQTLDAILDESM